MCDSWMERVENSGYRMNRYDVSHIYILSFPFSSSLCLAWVWTILLPSWFLCLFSILCTICKPLLTLLLFDLLEHNSDDLSFPGSLDNVLPRYLQHYEVFPPALSKTIPLLLICMPAKQENNAFSQPAKPSPASRPFLWNDLPLLFIRLLILQESAWKQTLKFCMYWNAKISKIHCSVQTALCRKLYIICHFWARKRRK